MARRAHKSPQVWQITPREARQRSPKISSRFQGGVTSATRAPVSQALTHDSQKVHSPRLKSTSGYPADPCLIIFSGHAASQSPQDVQRSVKSDSLTAQGGLTGRSPVRRPRSRLRLERSTATRDFRCQGAVGGPNSIWRIQITSP